MQEDQEFKASLSYLRPCLKVTKPKQQIENKVTSEKKRRKRNLKIKLRRGEDKETSTLQSGQCFLSRRKDE